MSQELQAYKIVNLILAGVISIVFIYSGIFSYTKENHPIPSFHTVVTGEKTTSAGLSRSFSAIVRLEFEIAHQFNPYCLRVFLFFIIQFVLRILFYSLLQTKPSLIRKLVWFDIIISTLLFFFHFEPFIKDTLNS